MVSLRFELIENSSMGFSSFDTAYSIVELTLHITANCRSMFQHDVKTSTQSLPGTLPTCHASATFSHLPGEGGEGELAYLNSLPAPVQLPVACALPPHLPYV